MAAANDSFLSILSTTSGRNLHPYPLPHNPVPVLQLAEFQVVIPSSTTVNPAPPLLSNIVFILANIFCENGINLSST